MTKIFLEHLPWLPVIQPYEDYGLQKYVEWTPNPNQQFEIRASTSSSAARSRVPAPGPPCSGAAGRGRHSMRGLLPFLAHRLFRALIALWLVSTVVFVVMRLSGDPVPLLLPPDAPRSEILRVRAELGLDRPLPVQYGVFLGNIAARRLRPLHPLPRARLHRGAGLPRRHARARPDRLRPRRADRGAHRAAARRCGATRSLDHVAMGVALVGQSAPTFFLGILFILLLSLKADLFPTSGRGDWTHLVLPALTLGAFTMASIARLTRSAVLEVLGADYIRTARAKGVRRDVGGGQAHAQERGHPDRDHHRAAVRHAARRRRGDGDRVRVARHRPARHPVHLQPRLPGGAVHGVPRRR